MRRYGGLKAVKKAAREAPEVSQGGEAMRCVSIALPPPCNIPKTLKLSPEDRALKLKMVDEMGFSVVTVRRRGDVYHAFASGSEEHEGTGSTARKALLCIVRDAAAYARRDADQLGKAAAEEEKQIVSKYHHALNEHLKGFGRACDERKRADRLEEFLRAVGDES